MGGDWGWQGQSDRALDFPEDGEQEGVSPLGRARLRYNSVANQMEQSLNAKPFTALGNGGGATGGGSGTVPSTPYAVESNDQLVKIPGVVIGSAVFITLPLAADFSGRKIIFKNLELHPATFTTVSPTGGDTLDEGNFAGTIIGDFSSITLMSDGVSDWSLVGAV